MNLSEYSNNSEVSDSAGISAIRASPPGEFYKKLDAKMGEAARSASVSTPPERPPSKRDPPDTNAATLSPHAESWRPLNAADAKKVARLVEKKMRRRCSERSKGEKAISMDFPFWRSFTEDILTAEDTVSVAAIPAGSGKSTWIEAFLSVVADLRRDGDPLARRIGAILVVKERVESLNEISDSIPPYKDGRSIYIPMQAPSRSGINRGLCRAGAKSCSGETCRYAGNCDILRFREEAQRAPLLGITQQRFHLLRSNGRLEDALRWSPDGLFTAPRTLVLFDEKYELAPVDSVNLRTFNAAKDRMELLVKQGILSDSRAQFYEQQLLGKLERVFQDKRRQLRRETSEGIKPKTVAELLLSQDEIGDAGQSYFANREQLMQEKGVALLPEIHQILSVFDTLYSSGTCVASRAGDSFTIFSNHAATVAFDDAKTVVFDATAPIDEDYASIRETARILTDSPKRTAHRIVFHTYPAKECNVSRTAYGSSWKVPTLVTFVTELMVEHKGTYLLFSYKEDFLDRLTDSLIDALGDDDSQRLALMPHPESGRNIVPYHGGTSGSNAFNQCDAVVFLGYPRLNGQEYLQRTIAAYGIETVLDDIREADAASVDGSFVGDPRSLPCVRRYTEHHLAAAIEQAIYRCKHRNANCDSDVHVHLLCPDEGMMAILKARFPDAEIKTEDTPQCFLTAKSQNRRYRGEDTSSARLLRFIEASESWETSTISAHDIREKLGISKSVWADLLKKQEIIDALDRQHITRSRGRNAAWTRAA